MEKKITSHIVKGLTIVAVFIALDIIRLKISADAADALKVVPIIILVAGAAISGIIFSKQSGVTKFGDVFAHGFRTTAVVTFFLAVYTYFAVKYIYPPPAPEEIEMAIKEMLKQGNLTPDQARASAIEGSKKMWVVYVSSIIFVSLISGVIGSLIGAAFSKKNQ